jgi:hypothetical protein
MQARSIDDRVDIAERNLLDPAIEAEFVERVYAVAAREEGKGAADRSDDEVLQEILERCQGSVRVALLARRRARDAARANPSDRAAAEVFRLLTEAADSFLPSRLDPRSYE